MTSTLNRLASVYLVTQLFVTTVTAQSLPNTVQEMRAELDVVNFDLADDDMRVKRLEMLLPHSEALAKENPSNAGFQMMAGFYNAQYAGYAGGIGALKYAKAARSYLEQSVNIDPQLHGASAHVVLGTLYAQVPGWPIGFGDKKGDAISSPQISRDYLTLQLRDKPYEAFFVMFLDSKHRVIYHQELFRGTIDSASVPVREVVKEALKHNAAALIVAHNHPSGVAEPSAADKSLTQALYFALDMVGVKLLDHFVVAETEVISFAEMGALT